MAHQPTTGSVTRQAADAVFVRKATGLVREASTTDAVMYNLIWSSIPLAATFLFLWGPAFYPGLSMSWTILINALICLPTAALYAMLSSSMPRSGADYVWVSRSVHPALGFMSNFNFVIWMLYFLGVYASLIGTWGISPFLRVVSGFTGNKAFLSAAQFFVEPVGIFFLGAIIILISGGVLIFGRGLSTFMRVQKWGFMFYFLGGLLLPTVVLFLGGGNFAAKFDAYLAALGADANGYQAMLDAAAFSPSPFSIVQTILAMSIPFYVFGNIFQSAYFAGEIKRGKSTHILSMPITLVVAAVLMLLLNWSVQQGIGLEFLGALGLVDPAEFGLGFTPIYTELAAVASGNLVIGALIPLSFMIGLMTWLPQTMVLVSRSLFAWSFDQLMPEKLSEVNERTRSPVVAMSVIVVLSLVSTAIVSFVPGLTALVGLLGLTITLILVSVAGIVFPYRQPDTWQGSPFNGRTMGMPTISLFGVLSLVAMLAMAVVLLLDENSGTSLSASPEMVRIVAVIFVAGLPIYYIARMVQRLRGVDVDLVYREIPPE